jgi:hypothetical protein
MSEGEESLSELARHVLKNPESDATRDLLVFALLAYAKACERLAASFADTLFAAMTVDLGHFRRGCRARFQAIEARELVRRLENNADMALIREEAAELLTHSRFEHAWDSVGR